MIGAALRPAEAGVVAAVRHAAARTGMDFSYMMAQARLESGLDPQAAARTSSARGLYQFTAGTWLDTVRRHGAAHGLGWAADALKAGAGPEVRASILSLRGNAQAAALMAGEFARDNAARLEAILGRAASAADLYMAHFLGPAGAAKFLSTLAAAPDTPAAGLLPDAAAANRSVFFGPGGAPRSVAAIYDHFAAKIGDAPARRPDAAPVAAEPAPDIAALPQARARLAYMLLAELGA